jgi:GntR family transcriptional regulator / MocR family aminotransferase
MDEILSFASRSEHFRLAAASKEERSVQFSLRPRTDGVTRYRWLYEEIRSAIRDSRLAPGTRLPSTRRIAREYGLARGTVVAAFDQLAVEGYLDGTVGSGTYVRDSAPGSSGERGVRPRVPAKLPRRLMSRRGRRISARVLPNHPRNPSVEMLRSEPPMPDAFPVETWSRLVARSLRRGGELQTGDEPLGFRPLRDAIAALLCVPRGLSCTADQVVITAGAQQSLELVAKLVLDPGNRAWVEDPGHPAVASLLRCEGAEVIGVPVDAEGLDCEAGRRCCRHARLAYVTPGCQFPLGMTMTLERRLNLLNWARESGAWVFEDDHDSHLHFGDRPLAALSALDRSNGVIYGNSFGKLLPRSLRLGFMVLPPDLVEAAHAAIGFLRRYESALDQAVLAEFICEGHLEQCVRQTRALDTALRAELAAAAACELKGLIELSDCSSGPHVVGWLAAGLEEAKACVLATAHGIECAPLASFTFERCMPAAMVMGTDGLRVQAIRPVMMRLKEALQDLIPDSARHARCCS